MEDCCSCLSLKKQLEDLKQKHLLDFRTIKQKIISTDTLIRSYQEKCQEYDKQKRNVVELTSKLEGAQRSVEVFKLQLKKSLEIKEPLKKKCDELEREKAIQRDEIEALQNRLKGSENLVAQLQTVIKQDETSADSLRIETSLHAAEIEEHKKSLKKNEAQISKLNEQVAKEKKANKEVNKELVKAQNKIKSLLDEAEGSKNLVAELRKKLDIGQNDVCEQPTRSSLEKQLTMMRGETEEYKKVIKELKEEMRKVKQQNTDENKNPEENKVKSPTTSMWSLRSRKSVTPKRGDALEITEQRRPFTRLHQRNLVQEIEKATLQSQANSARISHSSQQEILTSESENDEEQKRTLMDKVNQMLDISYCPSLSPLPSSPLLGSESGSSVSGFEIDCHDHIFDDNIDCGVLNDNFNHDVEDGISSNDAKDDSFRTGNHESKSDPDTIDDSIGKDGIDNIDHSHSKAGSDNIDRTVDNKVDNGSIVNNITDESILSNSENMNTINDGTDKSQCNTTPAEKKSHNFNENKAAEFELVDTNLIENDSCDQNDTILGTTSKTKHEIVLPNKDIGQARGKKRELTTPEHGGTLMNLRSRKKRKNENTGIAVDIFSKEACAFQASESRERALRSKSANLKKGLNTHGNDVKVRVTRSKSLQEGMLTEGILEVRPRRRTKRRISSNDSDTDRYLVSSDTSTLENNSNTSKNFLSDSEEERQRKSGRTPGRPRTRSMNEQSKQDVVSELADDNGKAKDGTKGTVTGSQRNIQTLIQRQMNLLDKLKSLQTMSTGESSIEDIVATERAGNDDSKSVITEVPMTENQPNIENFIQDPDPVMGTQTKTRTRSMDELSQQDTTTNVNASCKETEVLITENQPNIEAAVHDCYQWVATPRRPRTRSMGELIEPEILNTTKGREDEKASRVEVPALKNQASIERSTQDHGKLLETPRRPRTRSMTELTERQIAAKTESGDNVKASRVEVPTVKYQSGIETLTPRRPRTRYMNESSQQKVVTRTEDNEDVKSSEAKLPEAKKNARAVPSDYEHSDECQDTLRESSGMGVEGKETKHVKCNETKVPSSKNNAENDCSLHRLIDQSQHISGNELLERKQTRNTLERETTNSSWSSALTEADGKNQSYGMDIVCSDKKISTPENLGEKDCNEVLMCLKNIVDVVASETNETHLSRKILPNVATESFNNSADHRIQMDVSDCLNAVVDLVGNSEKSSALAKELGCEKLQRTESCTKKENKAGLNSLDLPVTLEPVSRILAGTKLVSRKAHQRKTIADGSGNRGVDQDGESKTVEIKEKTETSELINDSNKVTGTVSEILNETKNEMTMNNNQNVPGTRKRKHKTVNSGGIYTSNTSSRAMEENNTKPSFDSSDFLNLSDLDSVANSLTTSYKTNKNPCRSKKDIVNEELTVPTSTNNSAEPTTPEKTSSSVDSWEKQSEQMPALSPIPDTPKRSRGSLEIPSFDSFHDVPPLSPLPLSPCRSLQSDEVENTQVNDQLLRDQQEQEIFETDSADSRGTKRMKRVEPSISNVTFRGNTQQSSPERQASKKPKVNTDELPSDPLNRYPNVNEPKYIYFMFTKLRKKEITIEQLVKAFSRRKNVKNHTPIISGVIEVLRVTQDDVEHALMERYACAMSNNEDIGEPIVSEFEMELLGALNRLCNYQRLSCLMTKLVKSLEIYLSGLFRSGKSDAGFLAICRIYAGVCRLMGEGGLVRVLCYDILIQNQHHSLTERMILAIAFVWPDVLGKGTQPLSALSEEVSISGPPYHPFLATLQVTLMSREMSSELTSQWFQRICGWCVIPRDNNVPELLARDLMRFLLLTSDGKPEENLLSSETLNNLAFETIKSLELISVIMGWKWTNNILIREMIWPLLKEWKTRVLGKNERRTVEDQNCSDSNPLSVESQSDKSKIVEKQNVDRSDFVVARGELDTAVSHVPGETTILNVLRLLGRLGFEGLHKGEIVNLDAILNLMCAIVTSSDCESVTFNIQTAAAHALLDIFITDPMRISQVLSDWRTRAGKIDKKLAAQFGLRMKEVRSNGWTT